MVARGKKRKVTGSKQRFIGKPLSRQLAAAVTASHLAASW